jgi:hypothetical protein
LSETKEKESDFVVQENFARKLIVKKSVKMGFVPHIFRRGLLATGILFVLLTGLPNIIAEVSLFF